ncbi:rho GTPase-activating protein 29 isoform X1 [Esox lucius]|uniref:Rho GTPase-activating protein 29 n=2 Tax=Esox lucius TaxID=8010 RepID=A0A3P8ZKG5_ESOLU|nr:rho GTPase-activating protein 29 isoform X1 [Esox lucius]
MLRKSSSGTAGLGGENNTKQNKPCSTCSSRLCNPNTGSLSAGSTKAWDIGQSSRPANPLGCMGLGYNSLGSGSGLAGGPGVDPDYVMQLVNDVRRFADVLLSLKEAFHSKESHDDLPQRVQERLAELLRVLKSVIGKHQTLNSADILGSAGTVIAKVKGINFKDVNQENKNTVFGEIYASIDTLAFTFGNVVSDFLMGDVDSQSGLGIPQTRRSRSFENLSLESGEGVSEKNDLVCPGGALSKEEEVDLVLQKNDNGVESALLYAKAWSKYTKDLLAWVDKRLGVDIECAKSYAKLAESAKTLFSQQDYMPFRDMYMSTFRCDMEYSQLLIQTANALQTNRFIQPLQARKNELDRLRKDIKEQWQRQQRKMQESEMAVRKAGLTQAQRREEYQKAHSSANRSQEEPNKQLDRKRRQEEEALQKVEEAREQYRACAAEAGVRRAELAETKTAILTQIRELLAQCDLTLKAVTVNWCQLQRGQTASLPLHYQAQCDGAKLYEPGQRYAEFVRNLPKERFHMESLSTDGRFPMFNKRSLGSTSSYGNLSHVSLTSEVDSPLGSRSGERSNSATDVPDLKGGQGPVKGWPSGVQDRGMCSDSESAGGSSESRSIDSPTASPGDFKRRLPRTPSTGTMSSADDLDERELPSPSDNGLGEMVTETASSPGPFRNAQMSKASQTHKLRKLRAPSKCRECDSLVVFHGAECEECSLACHKKCLETLAIQCGHKKLQGRLHLFGIDFTQAAKNSPDGIPFIIKKCTSEIESRALNLKGIYRVNGAKSRVEKLCQAFENGKDLVELSDLSPHDIGNVLKLYLRQLPEPLILYRFYNEFIGLAKECQRVIIEEKAAARALQNQEQGKPGDEQPQPGGPQPCLEGEQPPLRTSQPEGGLELPKQPSIKLNRVVFKIRDLLRQLPSAHYRTLRFLTAHLHRVTEQSEENKMTASNLGIIFGPTLVKPRQTDAEVSLSSLVDYPYQALMVELMVRHFEMIFDVASPSSPSSPLPSPLPNTTTSTLGHASPRLLPQEQRLNRHSTSLLDIKESTKVSKRYSSVVPTSHTAGEVKTGGPGQDRWLTALERLNGVGSSATVAGSATEVKRSTLVFGRPSLNHSSSSASIPNAAPQVQLRPQRSRMTSRPISMPLERLPHPAPSQIVERNGRSTTTTDTITESPEPDKEPEKERFRSGVGSRVSTHYITPFIESQVMQRKTWDKKYKHYDVTPRTAMIMANIPAAGPVPQLTTPPQPSTLGPASSAPPTGSSVMPVLANNLHTVSVKAGQTSRLRDKEETKDRSLSLGGAAGVISTTASSPLTFRQPRTMQPPPGTFYKPPGSSGTRGWPSFTGSTGHTNTSPTSPNVKTSSSPTDKTFSSSPTIKTSSSSPMVKSSSSPSVLNSLFLAVPSSSSPTVPPSSSPSVQTSSSPPVTAPLLSSFHSSTITSSSSPVVSTTSPTSPNASPTSGTTNLSIHSPQDSVDSSVSGEFMTSADLSPPQSPPPSSPEDHSPTEVKPLHPRLRQRPRPHLQDLEHREAHFV